MTVINLGTKVSQPKYLSPDGDSGITIAAVNAPIKDSNVSALAAVPIGDWVSIRLEGLPTETVKVTNAPSDITNFEIKKFQLGNDGPSFQVASLGATPLQITTQEGKNILWNSLTQEDGNLKQEINWDLKGAGFLGGAPIVAPASRIADENGKPIIHHGDIFVELDYLVGANNRIPKDQQDEKGLAMHGAIFTSPHWKLDKLETKGAGAQDGVRVTYTLNFAEDEALMPFGAEAQAKVTYQLTKDEEGNPVFDTDLTFTNPPEAKDDLFLGAIAQHCFFDYGPDKTKARLVTNLPQRYEGWSKEHQSLPTGRIIQNESGLPYDFMYPAAGRLVYDMKDDHDGKSPLDAVLTNTDPKSQKKAILKRSDKLKIQLENGLGFNGIVVCTKNPNALMLEPIAARPNNFNTPGQYGELDQAIVLNPGASRRFTSRISLAA